MVDARHIEAEFRRRHGGGTPRIFRAPGRVNLIGEHTDYNDGFVLPVAIDRDTVVAAVARNDQVVRVHSVNTNETASFDLAHPGPMRRGIWLDYVEGISQSLKSRGAALTGSDLVIQSDVPEGAGLSSSAALEISVGMALLSIAGFAVDKVQLALAGQEAEHTYVGTMCGIMDQLVVACGKKEHALLIDCRSLDTQHIPMNSIDTAVIVCDTHVKHDLASSEYNKRRQECEEGVRILSDVLPRVKALRDVSFDDLDRYQEMLPETIRRRCRHVVTENARTLAAAEALREGDMEELGRLMLESHSSLRDDYEVSCRELDALVDIATATHGVFGARMTGGGFGGCTVNLVRRSSLAYFREVVTSEYRKAIKREVSIYNIEASDGAEEIKQHRCE